MLYLEEFLKVLRCPANYDRIDVQNPSAENICRDLKMECPDLASKLTPHASLF